MRTGAVIYKTYQVLMVFFVLLFSASLLMFVENASMGGHFERTRLELRQKSAEFFFLRKNDFCVIITDQNIGFQPVFYYIAGLFYDFQLFIYDFQLTFLL